MALVSGKSNVDMKSEQNPSPLKPEPTPPASALSRLLSFIRTSDNRIAEIIRFGLTGGLATVIQYAFYVLLVEALAVSPALSTVISYIISFGCNFLLSNYFTFRTRPTKKKTVAFIISHAFNMGLQTVLVELFKNIVPPAYALLPAMCICVPCNYLLVRFALKSKHFE